MTALWVLGILALALLALWFLPLRLKLRLLYEVHRRTG